MPLAPRLPRALLNAFLQPKTLRFAAFRLLVLGLLAATALQASAQTAANLATGWNLLGNSSSAALDVATSFGDANKVTTVWKWVPTKSKWAFYSPSLVGTQLADYASGKGYDVLTTIGRGEGFWVNAKTDFSTQMPAGTAVTSASFRSTLSSGWNLISTGDSPTAREFNQALDAALSQTGEISSNVITLWAWSSSQSNWYFYAPGLDAAGGTVLSDYISSKGYLNFQPKTPATVPGGPTYMPAQPVRLFQTMGFWANIPATTAARTILQDAAWTLGGRGLPTTMTWVNRANNTVTSQVISGELAIVVNPTVHAAAYIETVVSQHGGTIFAKLPAAGLYWVRVNAGQEASFIADVRPMVTDVLPNLVNNSRTLTLPIIYSDVAASATPMSGITSGNLILDDFANPLCIANCKTTPIYLQLDTTGRIQVDGNSKFVETTDLSRAATHGDIVNYFRTNKNTLYQTDNTLMDNAVTVAPNAGNADDILGLASMISGTAALGVPSAINYSRGPLDCWRVAWCPDADPNTGKKANTSEVPWEADSQAANQAWQESIAALLSANVPGARNAIVVQAAGNSATDLTSVLLNQQTFSPTAVSQIIQVGALDASGQIAPYSSFSSLQGSMIFVPVVGVTDKGRSINGTSFAAPQIQYLVNQIRQTRPDLSPAQVRELIFDPAISPKRAVHFPSGPIDQVITIPVILNPFDPEVLKAALTIANTRFATNSTTTTTTSSTSTTTSSTTTTTVIPPNIIIFRGTATSTATHSQPNTQYCYPKPMTATSTFTPITVEMVLDANPLALGPLSGTLYLGPTTQTVTTAATNCVEHTEASAQWTVTYPATSNPGTTYSGDLPEYSIPINGHSDGTTIVIDPFGYDSETFTATVSTAAVTGIVKFLGQHVFTMTENDSTVIVTRTYTLTRQ